VTTYARTNKYVPDGVPVRCAVLVHRLALAVHHGGVARHGARRYHEATGGIGIDDIPSQRVVQTVLQRMVPLHAKPTKTKKKP
jgi:hypothetical protein